MTDSERITQLEAEHAAKDRQIAELQERIVALEAQVQHLLLRLAKDSQNGVQMQTTSISGRASRAW